MGRFGVGQAIVRVEDERLLTGGGRYTDDVRAGRAGRRRVRPLTARPCRDRRLPDGGGQSPARRAGRAHRGRPRRRGDEAPSLPGTHPQPRRHASLRAAAAGARARPRAPCRRSGGVRRGRDAGPGARGRGGGRDRLRRPAGRDRGRCRRWSRGAAGLGRKPPAIWRWTGRPATGPPSTALFAEAAHIVPRRPRQQPRRRQLDGAARLPRRARPGDGRYTLRTGGQGVHSMQGILAEHVSTCPRTQSASSSTMSAAASA